MVLSLVPRTDPLTVVDEPLSGASNGERVVERVVFHPSRGSIVSVKGDTLEELDVLTGALLCHITFDLLAAASLDVILPAGAHYVVGLFQARYLVVWDLDEAVLLSTSDVDKVHSTRRVTALVTSLCVDRWLFFSAEGSNNVRVTRADYPGPAREILRKSSLRGGAVVSLAYSSEHHLLSSGCNDGTIQVWSIASGEDSELGGAKKAQDTSDFATPLFAVQLTPSAVVHISIGACTGCGTNASSSNLFLAAAYQNRRVDVVAMTGQAHTCVASTTLAPPQTADFSRLSGSLSLAIHPQLPVLLAHWHSARSDTPETIAAWEFVNSGGSSITSPRGGAGGNTSGGGAMTEWWNVANATALRETPQYAVQKRASSAKEGSIVAATISLWQNSLVVYASTMERRALFLMDVQQNEVAGNESQLKAALALSTTMQLTLSQYHDYSSVPSSLLQVGVKTSAKGNPILKLQRFSQHSGRLTASSDQLTDWQSERGVPLVPFQVLSNAHQSVVCIKLREKGDDAVTNGARPTSFSYVVLDLDPMVDTATTDVVISPDDEGDVPSTALPAIELKPGSLQHETRDACFCTPPTDTQSSNALTYVLVVLSSTGDTLTFQSKRDVVFEAGSRVKLDQPILRVFATPLELPARASSQLQSVIGSRLLYLVGSDEQQGEQLVLSEDDFSISSAITKWKSEPSERVVDVQWNSSSCPHVENQDTQQLMLAVTTTRRVVVLSSELLEFRVYDFKQDLMTTPQSLLWVSQTLLFATAEKQIRYVTPVAKHLESSRLICSVADDLGPRLGFSSPSIQLLSLCGDRLCYSVSNPMTLHCRTAIRPVALCEPILLGYSKPNAMLRRIFEREILSFALTTDDSDRPVCATTNTVLEVAYHAFGWKDKVLKVLKALINSHEKSSGAVGSEGGAPTAPSSNYSRTSMLSRAMVGSIFLDAHRWEEFLRVFLAHDPALEEYVVAIDSDGAAKLPSKTGPVARRFRKLAAVFESIGQPDWAMRCLDLSGDDEALVTMLAKFGSGPANSSETLDTLQKSWTKLNPPLSAILKAAAGQGPQAASGDQNDPFTTLCCETVTQPMRRGRLLNSVAPLDRLKLATAPPDKKVDEGDGGDNTRAGTLPWKRLAPEDASEWLGIKAAPRLASTEPRPLNYSIFAVEASATIGAMAADTGTSAAAFTPAIPTETASAKMSIGPFQDEEDAVVAYWRFEEGAPDKQSTDTASTDPIECVDTSKRENNLKLVGGAVTFVESSAPVDRGEPGRLAEEFALHFPSSATATSSLPSSGWGAHCPIRPGSTLDIGTAFDEDPYRREFTFEAWIRNYKLSERLKEVMENGDEPAPMAGGVRQQLVARQRVDDLDDDSIADITAQKSWELTIDEDDYLVLAFGSQQVKSTQKMEHSGNQGWRHVAFTVDVSSPQRVTVKLYLDARCVGESQATPSSQTVSKPSRLLLGWRMQDYELTEVRLWATARSAEQLGDMRENYLGIAEAKRKMKIAIHQRNCTCEKCTARRAQSVAGAGLGAPRIGLPLSTPLAPPSTRSRRVVPQAKPT